VAKQQELLKGLVIDCCGGGRGGRGWGDVSCVCVFSTPVETVIYSQGIDGVLLFVLLLLRTAEPNSRWRQFASGTLIRYVFFGL